MAEIYRPQKKDPLEQILQGVQLAAGVLGIRESWQRYEAGKQQQAQQKDESERLKTGQLTPIEESKISMSMVPTQEGTPGAVKFISPTTNAPIFYRPKTSQESEALGWASLEQRKGQFENEIALSADKARRDQLAANAKINQEERYKADEIKEKFMKDPKTMMYQGGFESSQELQNLLEKDDPIIDAVSLRRVFKLSGDVGPIRAEDLQQLGASPALIDQAMQTINMALQGTRIEPEQRASLIEFAKDMEANNRLKMTKHGEAFAGRLSDITPMNKSQALQYLNPSGLLYDIPIKTMQPKYGPGTAIGGEAETPQATLDRFLGGK
jgi:hypothetical protein